MYGAIGYYDWMISENRSAFEIPPSWEITDSSAGGTVVGSLSTISQELMTATYGRNGLDESLGEFLIIDINTNSPVIGETQAPYGAIAAIGVKLRRNGLSAYLPSKVTITIDPNSGSYGGGTVYSKVVHVAAADPTGSAAYPNRSAVVFPWESDMSDTTRRNGGRGGASRNKIRIKVEPAVTAGYYDVMLTRVMVPRCFFCRIGNGSLLEGVNDESDVQRSYSGYPYVNKKRILRRVSGTFVDLTKPFVYGVDGTTEVDASVRAVNGFAGRSTNVIFSPRLAPPADETSSGAYLAAWSNEHVVGLMDAPLTAQLQTVINEPDKMLWNASFAILETPMP